MCDVVIHNGLSELSIVNFIIILDNKRTLNIRLGSAINALHILQSTD